MKIYSEIIRHQENYFLIRKRYQQLHCFRYGNWHWHISKAAFAEKILIHQAKDTVKYRNLIIFIPCPLSLLIRIDKWIAFLWFRLHHLLRSSCLRRFPNTG